MLSGEHLFECPFQWHHSNYDGSGTGIVSDKKKERKRERERERTCGYGEIDREKKACKTHRLDGSVIKLNQFTSYPFFMFWQI